MKFPHKRRKDLEKIRRGVRVFKLSVIKTIQFPLKARLQREITKNKEIAQRGAVSPAVRLKGDTKIRIQPIDNKTHRIEKTYYM